LELMSKSRATQHGLIPLEVVERRIYFIRTHKVMLDSDRAELYGVRTKRLNEQVKRNIDRFPADFMFRLNQEESDRLRSQFATSKHGRGGRRYQPYVFTEHGALMLASVLNSERALFSKHPDCESVPGRVPRRRSVVLLGVSMIISGITRVMFSLAMRKVAAVGARL
jgi:ORF6N domain